MSLYIVDGCQTIAMRDRFPGIRSWEDYSTNVVPLNADEQKACHKALSWAGGKLVALNLEHEGKIIMIGGVFAGEYLEDAKDGRARALFHMDRTVKWFRENGYL